MPPVPPLALRSELLKKLLAYVATSSPYYRDQAWAARVRGKAEVDFHGDVPVTPKSTVLDNTTSFHIAHVPEEDGPVTTDFTSGSTGEPMKVLKTRLQFRMNLLENQRLKAGWGFNQHKRRLSLEPIKADKPRGTLEEHELPNGRRLWKLYGLEANAAVDLLARSGATVVTGYPSIVQETLTLAQERSVRHSLQLVSTYSEIVTDELRDFTRAHFGCRILDRYGAVETSLIASQCWACEDYHFADGHLWAEVLKDDGSPAAPGETGRVLLTPLYNRAMPLLRYDIGDYVELSKNNSCARSKTSIRRIVGREKNIFKLADGRRLVPTIPADVMLELGIRKFKLFQTTLQDVELHYIAEAETPDLTKEAAQRLIDCYLAPTLRVNPRRVTEISRSPSGKYLMHESMVG